MRDALLEAAAALKDFGGRRAIALLTDGQDAGSAVSPEGLASQLDSADVPVYPVYYRVDPRKLMKDLFGAAPGGAGRQPSRQWLEREEQAAAYLEKMADISAGTFYRSEVGDLDLTFARIAGELRNQYLLGFYPDRSRLDGQAHTLRVETFRAGLTVRYRRGYVAVRAPETSLEAPRSK
jgi:VWFA-related protein